MRSHMLAGALGAALLAAGSAHAQTVGMATSPAGSLYHTQGSAMAPILKEKGNIELRIQPFTSPNIHLPLINAGQVDFALANIYEMYQAIEGRDFFNGKKNENLRLITIISPLRSAIFVKKDSPAKRIADLKGQRVTWGYAQQNTIMAQIASYFEAAGLTEKDIVPVLVPAVVRGADDFAAGKADAFLFAVGSAKVTEVDASVGGIRALPMPDGAEAAFKKHFPPAYVQVVNPAPGLAGIVEPTPIMTYDAVMLTHAGVSDDVVYNMTRTLHENAEAVSKASPTTRAFASGTMAKKTDLAQYHPGAIKYYKEKGLWPQ
ncbi:MAG: TAXI family TRAP transporter solute-binding subunit [Bradyrhizobiaceae bacterium]|nr:TAXI family TRAP transporter solute-binding subunit [Bradyrhizobiaceae bacterium]